THLRCLRRVIFDCWNKTNYVVICMTKFSTKPRFSCHSLGTGCFNLGLIMSLASRLILWSVRDSWARSLHEIQLGDGQTKRDVRAHLHEAFPKEGPWSPRRCTRQSPIGRTAGYRPHW
ncbi:unnamed protein product, partial [Mycena citricolor]